MPKARNRIKYPNVPQVSSHSGDCDISGGEVCISIINSLGDVAELIESNRDGSSGIFQKRSNEFETQKKMLCDAIVDGANSLTSTIEEMQKTRGDLFWLTPARECRAFLANTAP